jgi:uncharacterized protein YbbC (DUF1343 family)/CubicO group peptidase (beta-lactamase class C family)
VRANRFLAAILLAPLAAAVGEARETSAPKPSGPLPVVSPASAGMSASRLDRIDAVVTEAIGRKELPGAVVLVGRHGKVVFRRAYGKRAVEPQTEPMTADTVFDLASLTKVVATATSVMTLLEGGAVRLQDPVVKHLPEFGREGGREKVTVEQLLTHRAGLVPDDPMALYTGTPAEIFRRKYATSLAQPPGSRFVYSDAGYEVLGELVRAVSKRSLDRYAAEEVFAPLGMTETGFRPLGSEPRVPVSRVAPTEKVDGRILRGEVHDPRARALGGVAGHAGLFSTADDLARYCRAILAGGEPVLSPAGVAEMTRPRFHGDGDLRALGWDVETSYSSNRGDLFPRGSFGHTGWTGTSLWLDPSTDTFVVFLSSRVHPDGSGNVISLRGVVATIVASAVLDASPATLRDASETMALLSAIGARAARRAVSPVQQAAVPLPAAGTPVRVGIDVLEAEGFKAIAGMKVALLTNPTGRSADGRCTAAVLLSEQARKAGVSLVRLFSPEHGPDGTRDEKVQDQTDPATRLPVKSLYGESRRPSPADLAGLDAVVVDLQDAGVRFYTYLTTLGYVMEEAAKANVKVVVLDRPNPIRASVAEGPPADVDRLSFTAYHTIPVRTGMTIGELAGMFNAERSIGAALTVVKMKGYSRSLWLDETGLAWVNPSPNLRSVTQAALYPGVALLEMTNVSVGRGTDAPFEIVGAPWVDGAKLASALSGRRIRGARFTPVRFTPSSSKHAGTECGGVRITVVDRDALAPVTLGLEIATALRDLFPKEWDRSRFGELLAHGASLARFDRGESAATIASGWAAAQMEFERRRAAFLLYE